MRIEQIKLTVAAGSPDALPAVHIGIEPHDAVSNLIHVQSYGLADAEEVVRFLAAVVDTIDIEQNTGVVFTKQQPAARPPFNPQPRHSA